jgi:hypothetical protein
VQFIQTLLTDEQALKIRYAIDVLLQDPERYVMTDEERTEYERLAVFWGHAVTNPSAFSPTGEMAQRVKTIVRRAKGPAQPPSRRNKRKARQEQRRAFQKLRRKQRREFNEQYNSAMEQLRSDAEEAERNAQELAAKYEAEPKFEIRDGYGNLIMQGIPKSAIVPMTPDGDVSDVSPSSDTPHIILPGTAEALGLG